MPDQVPATLWQETGQGYLASPVLSRTLRLALQPSCKFRQLTTPENAVGLHKGQIFHWPLFSDLESDGAELTENSTLPTTSFNAEQGTLIIKEHGQSVPYSETLDNLSEYPIKEIIRKHLKNSAGRHLDRQAHKEFNNAPVVITPKNGNSTTEVVFTESTTPPIANAAALSKRHVKAIGIQLRERNVPPHTDDHYLAIGRPSAYEQLTEELEAVHQYTEKGVSLIMAGEKGRYEGVRFVEQTNIQSEQWASGKSDWVFFIGQDAVAEGVAIPEEIRGKIPQDYGRDRGIAWYYLGGFGLAHVNPSQARVFKWASAEA